MNNDNIKKVAKQYLEKGWGVIPINFFKATTEDGKIKKQFKFLPTYKEYHQKKIAPEAVDQIWNGYNGVAITTGEISGISVIDVDWKDLPEIKDLPETFTVETYKGYHFYYRYNSEVKTINETFIIGDREFNVDQKNNGGIVFAEPSRYELPNGDIAEYKIVKNLPLAEFSTEWLKNIYKKYKPEKINGEGEIVKRDFGEIIYGVSQGERNDAAASLVGMFMSYLPKDKWEDYAWPLLRVCNTQNTPPLPEQEIRNTFNSIAENETKKQESLSGEIKWTPSASLLELLNKKFPEKKWLVENIFQRGTINQISAPPQQWKTWLTQHMAICIATGEKVFGQFPTDKQSVMIINEEDPESDVRERLSFLLGEAKNLPIYIHADKGIKLEEEITTKLLKEAKEKNIGFIIFDSLSVIHNADENSAKEMNIVFEQMKKFTREGITVLFTNHHRKKRYNGKDDIQEQTRGSTVINAVPSGHITCEEKIQDGNTFIIIRQAKLKGAKKINPFSVRVESSTGKIDFKFEGEHDESLDAATKLKNEIYEIIIKSDIWLGILDLKEITGKSKSLISKQIKILSNGKQIQYKTRASLIQENKKIPQREKPSGQEYLYFKIEEPIEGPIKETNKELAEEDNKDFHDTS